MVKALRLTHPVLPAHIHERVPQAVKHASVMAEIGNQVDASRVGAFIEAAAA